MADLNSLSREEPAAMIARQTVGDSREWHSTTPWPARLQAVEEEQARGPFGARSVTGEVTAWTAGDS